jgi:hypothetical protein
MFEPAKQIPEVIETKHLGDLSCAKAASEAIMPDNPSPGFLTV